VQRIMQTPPERLIELAGRTPILRTDRADMGERWAAV
jgi:DNA polymerase I